MRIIEPDHPFYRPLWRRVVIVAFVAAWFAFEVLVSRNSFFMVITAALTAYAAWTLLIKWKPAE